MEKLTKTVVPKGPEGFHFDQWPRTERRRSSEFVCWTRQGAMEGGRRERGLVVAFGTVGCF